MLLACRALNTVLDISPNVAKGRLILEVVPKLCQKLLNIDDIDVAEACAKWSVRRSFYNPDTRMIN